MSGLVFFALLIFYSCGNSSKDKISQAASEYNDQLISQVHNMIGLITEFYQISDFDLAQNKLEEMNVQLNKSLDEIKALGDFEGDSDFSATVLNACLYFRKVMNTDQRRVMELVSSSPYTREDSLQASQLINNIRSEMPKMHEQISQTQIRFAKRYNFSLVSQQ